MNSTTSHNNLFLKSCVGFVFLAVNFLFSNNANAQCNTISTYAGNQHGGYTGDGGPATLAELRMSSAGGEAIDASGNLYIADFDNNVVRKVTTSGVISTFAGNGSGGFSGDAGPANSAELRAPCTVACDATGNIYIFDEDNLRIRKVNSSGIISTYAGNGSFGFHGDGGPATSAEFELPNSRTIGLTVDHSGNLYIADADNNRIRMVNTSGTISTYAGNGTTGYSGDGGAATSAEIDVFEGGLTCDASNNLYIACADQDVIREVNTSGIISTFAGIANQGGYTGDGGPATSAEMRAPYGLAFDASGNCYIADQNNEVVRMVNTSGNMFTISGNGSFGFSGNGGPAIIAEFEEPGGVAFDPSGNLYICDIENNDVRKVSSFSPFAVAATVLQNVTCLGASTGSAGVALINGGTSPFTYSWSNGSSTVSTSSSTGPILPVGNYTVTVKDANGCIAAADAAITFAPSITITAAVNNNSKACTASGSATANPSGGVSPYTYSWSQGGNTNATITGLSAGTYTVKVTDNTACANTATVSITQPLSNGSQINTFAGGGNSFGDGGPATSATLDMNIAGGVTSDASGNIYIADFLDNVVRKVNSSGIISTYAGNIAFGGGFSGDNGPASTAELARPCAIACDALGNLYIFDENNSRIRKVNSSGSISTFAGNGGFAFSGDGGPATSAEFQFSILTEYGLAVDPIGQVFIEDAGNQRIRMVNTSGNISTFAGNGHSGYTGDNGPANLAELNVTEGGLACDASGNLYIACADQSVIRKVTTSGIITTFAGIANSSGFSGDNGPATSAELNRPYGLAFDASGNMYIADQNNRRVRMINTSGIISTYGGSGGFGSGGNGGPATSAQFEEPAGIAFDPSGNFYIADIEAENVRKVLPLITTLSSTAVVNQNTTTCGNTGQATVTASNGTPPYTYLWTGGNTNSTATGLTAATYTVTVVDSNACSSSSTIAITAPTTLTTTATVSATVSCNGGNNGNASASPLLGFSPYTYSWSNGTSNISTSNPTGAVLTQGTYTVMVIDNCGGTATASVTITQPTPIAVNPSVTNSKACASVGSVMASPSGGTPPYTYSWSPGGNTNSSISGLSAGTFTITVKDINGCNNSAALTITQPLLNTPVISTYAGNGISGFSGNGGPATSAEINAPRGVAFDNSGNLYITDESNNCIRKVSTSGTITQFAGNHISGYSGDGGQATSAELRIPREIAFDASGNAYTAEESNNVVREINTSGIISTFAGNGVSGYSGDGGPATAAELDVPYGIAFDASGNTYIVDDGNNVIRMVNSSGIISTVVGNIAFHSGGFSGDNGPATSAELHATADIAFDASGNLYIADQQNNRIRMVNTSGIITTIAGNGVANYRGDGGPATSAELNGPVGVSFNAAGNLYISDQNNNVVREVKTSGVINTFAGNGHSGFSGDGGAASSAELSFASPNVAFDASGNMYISDDGNNRIRKVSLPVLSVSSSALVNQNASACSSNGIATASPLNGTTPYTYSWSDPTHQTTVAASGLSAGSYTVTVTDSNACTSTSAVIITAPPSLSASASATTNVNCHGNNTGVATASPSGGTSPFTYSWSDASSQSTIAATGLSAGTYTVTTTDANTCTVTASVTITQPAGIISSVFSAAATCRAGSDGEVEVFPSGGAAPFTYSWSIGTTTNLVGTTKTLSGLSAGTYSVAISDANGCSASNSVIVGQPSPFTTIGKLLENVACEGSKTGAVQIIASGGKGPYTYSWSNGSGLYSMGNLSAGTYTCTATDHCGFTATVSLVITQPATALTQVITQRNITCNGNNDGIASTVATGGNSPYSYLWLTGATTTSVTGLSAGAYNVKVSDANGCSITKAFVITQPAVITPVILLQRCVAVNTGTVELNTTGGTRPYTYSWSNGSTNQDLSGLSNGSYTVTVTDNNHCTGTLLVTVSCTSSPDRQDLTNPETKDCCPEDIVVYPNPNNGLFTVQLAVVSGQWSVEVFNVLGEKVYSKFNIQNSTSNFDLSDKSNGIYLIRIINADGTLAGQKKVVKTN